MTTRRLAVATLPVALALAASLTSTASASTTAVPPDHDSLLFGFSDVLSGTVEGTPGNRHQLYLLDGHGGATGYLRSWTCPDDATVTDTWASSRCTHRITQDVREQWGNPPYTWISSTGRSGRFVEAKLVGVNRDSGYRRVLSADLTFKAPDGAVAQGADGHYRWSTMHVRGTFGGPTVWRTSDDMLFGWTT